MTWRSNLRALMLALVATAVVGFMVFFLYQSMRADKTWRDFVAETQTETKEAATAIEAAQETIEVAQDAGVDEKEIAPLIAQVEVSQALVDELGQVTAYATDPDQLENKVSASLTPKEEGSLAGLDLFAGLEAAGTSVVTPPRPYALIDEFKLVSISLTEALSEMEQLATEVEDAIDDHLGSLQDALAVSEESLIYEVARGKVLEQYALNRAVSDADLAGLRAALDNSQKLLVDQRGVDRNDASAVSKALKEVNKSIEDLKAAAAALVTLLGVDAQQMLDELTPEQLWQEQATWVPTPAPEPTTPTTPVVPTPPTTPVDPPDSGGGETGGGETGGGDTGGGDTGGGETGGGDTGGGDTGGGTTPPVVGPPIDGGN